MKQGIILCTLINLQLDCDLHDDKKNVINFLKHALKH